MSSISGQRDTGNVLMHVVNTLKRPEVRPDVVLCFVYKVLRAVDGYVTMCCSLMVCCLFSVKFATSIQ